MPLDDTMIDDRVLERLGRLSVDNVADDPSIIDQLELSVIGKDGMAIPGDQPGRCVCDGGKPALMRKVNCYVV